MNSYMPLLCIGYLKIETLPNNDENRLIQMILNQVQVMLKSNSVHDIGYFYVNRYFVQKISQELCEKIVMMQVNQRYSVIIAREVFVDNGLVVGWITGKETTMIRSARVRTSSHSCNCPLRFLITELKEFLWKPC